MMLAFTDPCALMMGYRIALVRLQAIGLKRLQRVL